MKMHVRIDDRFVQLSLTKTIASIPWLTAEVVKDVSKYAMEEVIDPKFMPLDLGRARAGFQKGVEKVGGKFIPIGYSRDIAKGKRLGTAFFHRRPTTATFKTENKVPYIGPLESSHKGRLGRKRWKPARFVYATGSYAHFVDRAINKTVPRVPLIAVPAIMKFRILGGL